VATGGSEKKVLRQVMAATNLIATNKVGVVGLQIIGGNGALPDDFAARTGCIAFQNVQRALGKRCCCPGPIGGRNLARAVIDMPKSLCNTPAPQIRNCCGMDLSNP